MVKVSDILRERVYPYSYQEIDSLARAVGWEALLEGDTQITLFAPNDFVLNKLKTTNEFDMLRHITLLNQLVQFHIVPVRLTVEDMRAEARAEGTSTLQLQVESGRLLTVEVGAQILIGGVAIVEPDMLADNGVVHGLDGILVPPGMSLDEFEKPAESQSATIYSPDEFDRFWPNGTFQAE
ncbi:hypothetical protein KSX_05210 [Ktedonospora formicarum]|uniref:FAS1 domain-containing protein n=2 Tax=Ktedonospora formicarum TaxID=2778364 RepID=A0A8J3MQ85_9CHLR|nr:hypothetical protein KSX_05210 [Ktedonospora formicarum]